MGDNRFSFNEDYNAFVYDIPCEVNSMEWVLNHRGMTAIGVDISNDITKVYAFIGGHKETELVRYMSSIGIMNYVILLPVPVEEDKDKCFLRSVREESHI